MTEVAKIRAELVKLTGQFLKSYGAWKKMLKIGLVFGGVLLAGIGGIVARLGDVSYSAVGLTMQIIGLVTAAFGSVILELLERDPSKALRLGFETTELAEKSNLTIAALKKDFQWFSSLYTDSILLRRFVEATASDQNEWAKLVEKFEFMLDVIVSDASILIGVNGDRWNFAIYWYCKKNDKLKCLVCRRPIRAEETAVHRDWDSGHGHVGLAFQQQKVIVAKDTSEAESASVFDAPAHLSSPDDKSRYRSIASLPIKSSGGVSYGVLVATSDIVGRYFFRNDSDNSAFDPIEPLRILADNLALAADIYYMRLMPQEDAT